MPQSQFSLGFNAAVAMLRARADRLDNEAWGEAADLLTDSIEDCCHRCGGCNVVWSAPSPLWNQVMRGGDIAAKDDFDGIICPICFVLLAQQQGVATGWRLTATRVNVELVHELPDGRSWDEDLWLWMPHA